MDGREPNGYNFIPDYLKPEHLDIPIEDINERVKSLERNKKLELLEQRSDEVSIVGASVGKYDTRPNQDAVLGYISPDQSFFCAGVFDGVGGTADGDEASMGMKVNIQAQLKLLANPNYTDILTAVNQGISQTKDTLKRIRSEGDTTMTLIFGVRGKIGADGKHGWDVFSVHVGDSRAYMEDANGNLRQITNDMGPVGENNALSKLERKIHPDKNEIYNSVLGPEENPNPYNSAGWFPYRVDNVISVNPDGAMRFRLATDGYSDNFREDEELDEVNNHMQVGLTPQQLVAAAQLRSERDIALLSKRDDITILDIELNPSANFKSAKKQKAVSAPKIASSEVDFKRMWEVINADRQLRGLLAEFALDDLNRRNELTPKHVAEFKKRYPTRREFEQRARITEFLNDIERDNGKLKRLEYTKKVKVFCDLIFD